MSIVEELQILGFDKKEAKVYFALLQLGRATAYRIALKSGLKRPTVYVVLEDLRQKEAVLKTPYAKRHVYIAKPPDELIENARNKVNTLISLLPEIKALAAGDGKPRTIYFEGIKGIKQILFYRLEEMAEKEFVGFSAYEENLPKELEEAVDKYNEFLRMNNIKTRGIVPKHPSLSKWRKSDKEYLREMKKVPLSSYDSRVSMDAGEDFVRIIAFKDLQGVIIENKFVAESLRQIFEMVWKSIK